MPIIVVSDCSPIRALHHLGLLGLCHDLYGAIVVPAAVRDELRRPTSTCPAIDIASFPHFAVQIPRAAPTSVGVPPDLDPGETQAIALAVELHADLVLMDERKGTQAAREMGLTTIGVFGLLLEARRKGLINQLLPLVDRLISELRFFASPSLRQRLAQLAGE